MDAVRVASQRGLNPGGEAMVIACGRSPGPLRPWKLLTRAELGPGKTTGQLADEGARPGKNVSFVCAKCAAGIRCAEHN